MHGFDQSGLELDYRDLIKMQAQVNPENADDITSNGNVSITNIYNTTPGAGIDTTAFHDGGDSFGHNAHLGTNDANDLFILRNATNVADFNASRLRLIPGYQLWLGATSGVFTNEVMAGYSTSSQVCTRLESTVATAVATYTARNDLGNHIECGVLNSTHVSTSTPAPGGCAYFGYTRVGGLGSNPKGLWIYNDHNEDINFATNTSLRMVLYRSGALCIGASAPVSTEALRVVGNVLMDSYTAGTIPYFGAGGLMSHNDTELLWDNGNHLFRGANVTMGQYPAISTIAHIKNSTWASGKYCIAMGDAGYTILNALNGQLLYLGINDHYYLQCVAGKWGFGEGTTTPRRLVDILDASNPQLRLSYSDNAKYLDIQVDSSDNVIFTGTGTGDFSFVPGGKMKFGTHTGIGAETVTGYITIKDSGGTSRKIAVVS